MTWIGWIVGGALVVVGVPYLLAPLLVYFNSHHNARPRFRPIDSHSAQDQLPMSYHQDVAAAGRLGFELVAHLYQDTQVPSLKTYMALLVHRAERTGAIVVYMLTPNVPANRYAEFATEFVDGSEIATNNSSIVGVFAADPAKRVVPLPQVRSLRELYAVHQALIRRVPTERKAMPEGREIEELCDGMVKDLRRQEALGYYRLDQAGGKFRPTVRGALLMTWKMVWPVGAIRKLQSRRRGDRLIRELAAGG